MKKFALLTIFFSIILSLSDSYSQGRPGNTELGIILGEPTGISLKQWQSGSTAIDGAVAWSFGRHESVHLHADYLKHNPLDVNTGSLYLYYGLGARAILSDNARFGARIPVGLQYIINSSRLSLFFEVAPTFDLAPATEFGVDGGIGIRYFL